MNITVYEFLAADIFAAASCIGSLFLCPWLAVPFAVLVAFLTWKTVMVFKTSAVIAKTKQLKEKQLQYGLFQQIVLLADNAPGEEKAEITNALVNTQAEMSALQNQINPHFLYNTLDTIRGQALMDGSTTVADMAEALSVLFRYSISNNGQLVSLRDELYCVDKYISIQQIRFRGRFQMEKKIDPELLDCLIPRLTLEPIVENAIFHGLESTTSGGTITITVNNCGEYMVINIGDNGIGIDEEALTRINEYLQDEKVYTGRVATGHGLGIALVNVNKRIRLTFGKAYGLSVSSVPRMGTDVAIILPIMFHRETAEDDK